jgi:predicted ABC-type transport system involved in lysophospholipase L1 biosynthesis ATPase subunit
LRFAFVACIAGRVNGHPVIAARDLLCARVVAGSRVDLDIPFLSIPGNSVTIVAGPAGCGKNLLLRVLGLLEAPDGGEVQFEAARVTLLTEGARADLRARRCGYVFASPFLLPEFTVIENIAMPLFKVCEMGLEQARARAEELLDFAGLQDVATSRDLPAMTQLRVALARALAPYPAAIFVEDLALLCEGADEFRNLLHAAAERYGVAVIASATRDGVARQGERWLELIAGRLASEVAS